jgi:hypothetical protein
VREEGIDRGRGGVTEEGDGGDGADGGVGRGAVRVGRRKKVVGITRLTIDRETYLKVIKMNQFFTKIKTNWFTVFFQFIENQLVRIKKKSKFRKF